MKKAKENWIGEQCSEMEGMLVETGKAFVDPSAMMTQMREDSGLSLIHI